MFSLLTVIILLFLHYGQKSNVPLYMEFQTLPPGFPNDPSEIDLADG